jgi:NMD protein affecting ribosome stability and mRNA decay
MTTQTAAIECKRCGKSSNDRFESIEAMQDGDGLCSVCYLDVNDTDD